jgi:hypothetical protein
MAGSAAAQPGLTPPSPPAEAPPSGAGSTPPARGFGSSGPSVPTLASQAPAQPMTLPEQPRRPGDVSEQHAVTIALGATLTTWSIVGVGIAAESGRIVLTGLLGSLITPSFGTWYAGGSAAPWLGMRALGAGVTFYGLLRVEGCVDGCHDENDDLAAIALLGGLGLYIAGTITDIATAPSAARRHNRERHALTVAPLVQAHGGGLMIGGAF